MQLGHQSPISTNTTTPVPGEGDRHCTVSSCEAPTLRDVVDAINPLEHIPFVSTLFDEWTGHTPSATAKLAGGAILGGPIGFVVSLADVIFTQQTGKPVGEAVVAALIGSGGEEATQVASHATESEKESPEQLADASPVDPASVITPASQEILPPVSSPASMKLASAAPVAGAAAPSAAVLDLYGGSTGSAHRSYQRAQLRPYLQDVTTSQVL